MDLAVSTLFCLQKPFEEALTDIILSSTRCIELTDDGAHTLNLQRVERLLELRSSYGLRYAVHAPFADVNIAALGDSVREATLRRLENSIRSASALEAEILVFHPGAMTALERFSPGKAWDLNLYSVRRLLSFAEEYGVSVMIENVPEPFSWLLKSIEDFKRFFEEINVEVKMVLDIAHAHLRGETKEFLRRFSDRIGHIHVSDNFRDMDAHLQIGEGDIDWESVMTAIKEHGFNGWVVVESYNGVENSLQLLERFVKKV